MSVAASMPPITVVPMTRLATAPDPDAEPERHAAENERERRHDDRTQTQARALQRRFQQRSAALVGKLRELNDQDCILGGHTDQHDEADLCVDIVFHAARPGDTGPGVGACRQKPLNCAARSRLDRRTAAV